MKIPGFGNMMLSSFEIRDPDSISRQLGSITFWVDRDELSGSGPFGGLGCHAGGQGTSCGLQAGKGDGVAQGCGEYGEKPGAGFYGNRYERGPHTVFPSSQYDFSYISVINSNTIWDLNRRALIATSLVLIILAGGALLVSFVGIRNDARFLSNIMQMLGAMENGDFSVAKNLDIHEENKNEYGRIAIALKDVSQSWRNLYPDGIHTQAEAAGGGHARPEASDQPTTFLYNNTLKLIRSKTLMWGMRGDRGGDYN